MAYDLAVNGNSEEVNITVLTKKNIDRKTSSNYIVREVDTISKIFSYNYWSEIKKYKLDNYDGYILNDLGAAQVAGYFFSKEMIKKSIIILHGNEYQIFSNKYYKFFFELWYKKLLYNSMSIIAVSQFMKKTFLTKTKLYKLDDKIEVITNGVDLLLFYPDKINLHHLYEIPKNKILLLTVARLVVGKGYLNMIEIFNEILKINNEHHWIIVGDGPDKKKIIDLIEAFNLNQYITLITNAERGHLRYIYSSVDLFWLLSDYEESFGLVYLEANACGIPVIGNDIGGVKESISSNKSGFLVKNKEECLSVILNRKYKLLSVKGIIENSKNKNIVDFTENILSKFNNV